MSDRAKAEVTLSIPADVYDAIRRHGERTYPHECCGVLLGNRGEESSAVEAAVEAGNTRIDSAHNRYSIAPQELISIQRRGRERGLDIVGFYHSHPDHPAQWSKTDLEEAHWIGCSYVITSVEQGAARSTNAFFLAGSGEEDKRFEDQRIALADAPASSADHAAPPAVTVQDVRC